MSLIISHKGENDSIALDMVMVRMMVYFSCLSALWCQYSRVYSVKYTLLRLVLSCPDFDPFWFLSRFWSFLILVQISILSYFCPDFDPFLFLSRFWYFLYFCPDFDLFYIFVQIWILFYIFVQILIFLKKNRFWSFLFFVQILILFKKCYLDFDSFLH